MNIFLNILMLLLLDFFFCKVQPRFILSDSTALVHFLVHTPWLYPSHCIETALLYPLTQMTSIWVIRWPDLCCWLFTYSWSLALPSMTFLSLSPSLSASVAHLLVPWLVSVSWPFPPMSVSSFPTWFTLRGSCSYQCFTSKCIPSALVPTVFWVLSSAYPTSTANSTRPDWTHHLCFCAHPSYCSPFYVLYMSECLDPSSSFLSK